MGAIKKVMLYHGGSCLGFYLFAYPLIINICFLIRTPTSENRTGRLVLPSSVWDKITFCVLQITSPYDIPLSVTARIQNII